MARVLIRINLQKHLAFESIDSFYKLHRCLGTFEFKCMAMLKLHLTRGEKSFSGRYWMSMGESQEQCELNKQTQSHLLFVIKSIKLKALKMITNSSSVAVIVASASYPWVL